MSSIFLFIFIIIFFISCVLIIYYIFFNLFSIFFNDVALYKNFEYFVNKIDNTDNNFDYYILLNEQNQLRKDIDSYKHDNDTYKDKYAKLIAENRNLLSINNVTNNEINKLDQIIKEINEGLTNSYVEMQIFQEYKQLLQAIYAFFVIYNDLNKFMLINNYKNIVNRLYIQNMLINDKNSLKYYEILRKIYIFKMLESDQNNTNYIDILRKIYMFKLILKDKNKNKLNYIELFKKIPQAVDVVTYQNYQSILIKIYILYALNDDKNRKNPINYYKLFMNIANQ